MSPKEAELVEGDALLRYSKYGNKVRGGGTNDTAIADVCGQVADDSGV